MVTFKATIDSRFYKDSLIEKEMTGIDCEMLWSDHFFFLLLRLKYELRCIKGLDDEI